MTEPRISKYFFHLCIIDTSSKIKDMDGGQFKIDLRLPYCGGKLFIYLLLDLVR